MRKNSIQGILIGIASLFLFVTPALAHVIVYPHQVGIAQTMDFTVSVPNERDTPVTKVRLLIPSGMSDVQPNTTQGWTITTKSVGKGDSEIVSEIDWSNGSIPVGQREEFIFQAQVPPQPVTLDWKAYQTYSDGTVVSWDQNPQLMANLSDAQQDALADKENKGEYSTTQVINDLSGDTMYTQTNPNEPQQPQQPSQTLQLTEIFSGLAIIIAIFALFIAIKKK